MAEPLAARAFWSVAPGRSELREEELDPPQTGQVLVRTVASGVSRGSESLVFQGLVPRSQFEVMRAPHQNGAFPFPVKYGYAALGVVEQGPAVLRGRRVFCLHPHQDRFVVAKNAVLEVPEAIPDHRAVLAANVETALNGLWDAAPLLGQRIAVVGAGVVGAACAALAARLPGAEVELIDIDDDKAWLARALGVRFVDPDRALGEADLVVHASGTAAGLATALELAGLEATVLELSWYGSREVQAPLGEGFHDRRLTLRSSRVGAVAPAQRPRWSNRRRLALALALLADPRFDALLEPAVPFEHLPDTMAALALKPGAMCQVVSY